MSRYIYETKTVGSGRKDKHCEACGASIPKGKSSITVTYFNSAEFDNVSVCNDTCYKKYEKNFDSVD